MEYRLLGHKQPSASYCPEGHIRVFSDNYSIIYCTSKDNSNKYPQNTFFTFKKKLKN